MYCEACGVTAPTKYVSFHQNIGILIMRFYEGVEGNLCRNCVNGYFWRYSLVNMTLGWWGLISLIVTPFFIINNLFYYVPTLGMEGVPEGAAVQSMELTEEDVHRLSPFNDWIVQRLNANESVDTVVTDVALRAGVSSRTVYLYLKAMVDAAQ